jgi:hypothetical protein
MDIPADALIDSLSERAGLGPAKAVTPLAGGSNNRVFKVEASSGKALLKLYHRSPDDPRDRLAAEFGFSRYAWDSGVKALPEPLASEPERGAALYEFIEGRKLDQGDVTPARVDEALAFFEAVNRNRTAAAALPEASEARFSVADHMELIGRRLERLVLAAGSPLAAEAAAFARGPLSEAWRRIEKRALAKGAGAVVPLEDRRVSPSDFGFHNALIERSGELRFIDFEYAGWDDPAKLVCDFFCQPAVPAPAPEFERFAERVARGLRDRQGCLRRIDTLFPAYQVKWCCILLNEFAPEGARRRRFAGAQGGEAALRLQLEKAKAALAKVRA